MRVALNLKNITYTHKYLDLINNEPNSEEYSRINPSKTVPTLIVTKTYGPTIILTQSIPSLEYLDEAYPNLTLLPPKGINARATVRAVAAIIASDVQPVTNSRILTKVSDLGADKEAFAKEIMTRGVAGL
jgi:maleylacetoacetate isomerase